MCSYWANAKAKILCPFYQTFLNFKLCPLLSESQCKCENCLWPFLSFDPCSYPAKLCETENSHSTLHHIPLSSIHIERRRPWTAKLSLINFTTHPLLSDDVPSACMDTKCERSLREPIMESVSISGITLDSHMRLTFFTMNTRIS